MLAAVGEKEDEQSICDFLNQVRNKTLYFTNVWVLNGEFSNSFQTREAKEPNLCI